MKGGLDKLPPSNGLVAAGALCPVRQYLVWRTAVEEVRSQARKMGDVMTCGCHGAYRVRQRVLRNLVNVAQEERKADAPGY